MKKAENQKINSEVEKEILYFEDKYHIQRYSTIPEEVYEFLDSMSWGNEGAVYEHKNTKNRLQTLHSPMLLTIQEGEQIRGTAVFCHTDVLVNGHTFNYYYIRYFASSKEIQGKGIMKHFSLKVMELIRKNEIRKTIYTAVIEKGNKGSYKVVENAGYTKIGIVKSMGFSRFFPKKKKNIVQVISPEDKKEVLRLLNKEYCSHSLVHFNSIFLDNNYYVIRENNEIVAGCQYHRAHWVINGMAGFTGKIIMKVVPHIPVLNKLFNPKRFEFLAFEGIYFKAGYQKRLYDLFEGLLAKEKLKSAMFWMGETCPIRAKLVDEGNPGLLNSFVKDSDIYIMASFQNMDKEEISMLHNNPLYVSSFDYI